uniref:Uncharacterized protein n=1 Tax=Coprothermobacter proteolyticus (strain ATCC 35245 / DSM 5265 / OCM 4 / BT) TaxID=309798 RepID=B5Y6V8_COPPD
MMLLSGVSKRWYIDARKNFGELRQRFSSIGTLLLSLC